MKILGWDDLRLTLEETRGIVPLKTREAPSQEVIDQLHRTTDGWVAGLVLILAMAIFLPLWDIGRVAMNRGG